MATMTVSLPEQMKKWVESRVTDGTYGSASDYIRDLIGRDRDSRISERPYTVEELKTLLAEARAGGPSGMTIEGVKQVGRRIAAANGWLDGRG